MRKQQPKAQSEVSLGTEDDEREELNFKSTFCSIFYSHAFQVLNEVLEILI